MLNLVSRPATLPTLLLAVVLGCDGKPWSPPDAGALTDAARMRDGSALPIGDACPRFADGDAGESSSVGGNAGGFVNGPTDAAFDGGDDDAESGSVSPLGDADVGEGLGAPIVILLIGDGYGAAQIDATRMFINGDTEPLCFEQLPHQAWVSTNDAYGNVTDSGAGATALATGHKVASYTLSIEAPGDGHPYPTALEIQAARGRRTGLVTTHTPITDATPAAFGAHAMRFDEPTVANQLLTESRPNVLFGLSSTNITPEAAEAAGYTVVQTATELAALDLGVEDRVSGQFTEQTVPPLRDLALAALDLLDESPNGFFLLVEQEQTDTGGHLSDLSMVLSAAVEFHEMAEAVLNWAEGRDDTLIIVGADHETGGLVLSENNPMTGVVPEHTYTSNGAHTGAEVRFFASGVRSEAVSGHMENTDIFPLLAGL